VGRRIPNEVSRSGPSERLMSEPFDFPESFVSTDAASLAGQQRFIRSTRIQLVLLVLASGAGAFSWTVKEGWDAAALLAGIAFTAAAILRIILIRERPHRLWYDGRAAAESIKTLSWKYAAAGDPFLAGEATAQERFEGLARDVLASFDTLGTDVASSSSAPTESMRGFRTRPLNERRDAYAAGRIQDQQSWYQRKADWNKKRARFWGALMLVLQVAAAIGAFLKGFDVIDIDLFGLAGAAAASAAAWLETKQHHVIARAYRVAAQELSAIADLIPQQETEAEWARFVAEAEEAISREHTMWKASSRSREPLSLV
jgi:hypothetical protein